MYDVIGDIHGHADALRRLLAKMDYEPRDGCWQHPERKVVFVGDFVDRGPDILGVLEIVRPMVEAEAALAVMGNHEFNAIAFHTPHPTATGAFLRVRSYNNIRQCRETVRQLNNEHLDDYINWFRTLPMWLDLDGLRVVHACWDSDSMKIVEEHREQCGGFTNDFFYRACERGEALYTAVEVLLKGRETPLPDGVSLRDKDGHERTEVRTRWYADPTEEGMAYRDYAFSFRKEEQEQIGGALLSPEAKAEARPYGAHEPPVLFGHYWMPSEFEPAPLAPNVACLDYSVAKNGKLCAYRWHGEAELRKDAFVSVTSEAR